MPPNTSQHAADQLTRPAPGQEARRLGWLLAAVVPMGFATKLYTGPGDVWVRSYAGGVLYEVFWILLALLVWRGLSPTRTAAGVFVVTCLLEVLQLWHPASLETVRNTFIGHALIGNTFSWGDFPCYAIGSIAGAALGAWASSAGRVRA